jgi:hypothetical protein
VPKCLVNSLKFVVVLVGESANEDQREPDVGRDLFVDPLKYLLFAKNQEIVKHWCYHLKIRPSLSSISNIGSQQSDPAAFKI